MPDFPRSRAAWRTCGVGDSISQNLISSSEVKHKHFQFMDALCSGILPGNPSFPSSEFWEPAYLILQHLQLAELFLLKLLRAADSAWPNDPGALRTRSHLHSCRQAMAVRQRTTCESTRQQEAVSLLCKGLGNTQVP